MPFFAWRDTKQGRSQGGPGMLMTPPPLGAFLSKQTTTSGENFMKIWRVSSLWHTVTPTLKNPGYAPAKMRILHQEIYLIRRFKLLPDIFGKDLGFCCSTSLHIFLPAKQDLDKGCMAVPLAESAVLSRFLLLLAALFHHSIHLLWHPFLYHW